MNPNPVEPAGAGKDRVLVFTDMESSSRLWETEGGKFYSVLQAHMDLIQEACQITGGYSVKSTGDGYFIVFERPEDALRFSLACQINLSRRPELPRARIGIDRGEVFEVTGPGESRDYVGPAANRAARICALAAATTVLVSERAALSVRDMPLGAKFESVGNHSLRNIGLEAIYLLKHGGLGDQHPETRGSTPVLPWSGDLFVGRDSFLESVVLNFRDGQTRCVSIVGFGGMGKTRLSLEAARRLTSDMTDGIAFAELDGIRDMELGWSIIAGALRTLGYEGEPKLQDAAAFLLSKNVLLILDGVEGLPRPADMVSGLVDRTKNLKILVTSRNRIKATSVSLFLESLLLEDAERLLRARIHAYEPDLDVAENDPDIVELCRRLDCIPLSIELAAARASLMTPGQMLERIETRFTWMTDSAASESDHRRSLEATIAWSYDLLSASGQAALKIASLFSTGFRLDAWERLMGSQSLDALGELQRSSLVSTETRSDQPGKVFYLLETIRHFAAGRLKAETGLRGDAVARFATDLLDQARRRIALCRTPAEASALRGLDELAPNLQGALDHLIELDSNRLAADVCEVLAAFNHYCGRNRQARDVARRGLVLDDVSVEKDSATRAGLLRWLASASLDLGDAPASAQSAFTLLEFSKLLPVDIREREKARAHNLAGLAFTASVEPKSAAKEFEIALSMAVATGDSTLEGMIRHNMGWLAFCHNEMEDAATNLEAARLIRERLGDLRGIAETSSNLGLLEQDRGQGAAALVLHHRSLACWSTVFDMEGMGKAMFNLAECSELLEKGEAAKAYYAGALVMFGRSESQYVDHARLALQRLGDPEKIEATLLALEPSAIVEWLANRFGNISVANG